jgi:four helix bundle protein
MSAIISYRDLDAWQAAMDLLLEAYVVARRLPPIERFALADQMRPAAVSVPSNIAEGQASGPGGRYRHHVRIALGSLGELDTLCEAVKRLAYLSDESLRVLTKHLERTGRLVHGLDRALRRRQLTVTCLVVCALLCTAASLIS